MGALMLRKAAISLVVFIVLGVDGGPRAPETLGEKIEEIIEGEYARTAFWGIYVQDLDAGRLLYSRNAEKTLIPASNQKLLTTAAALDVLGSAYRYETTLHLDGQIQNTVLRGDLILEGSGDPTFGSQRFDQNDPLRHWADSLAALGVTRIEGRIIGDDDIFDDNRYAQGWDITHIATRSFAPARGGLSYRGNVVDLRIEATRRGQPPTIEVEPAGYFDIVNQATTSARRRGPGPRLDRRVGTEAVRVYGAIPRAYRRTLGLPVSDPTAFTLHLFERYLREAGIDVAAPLYDVDDLDEKPTYETATPLFVHTSPPLAEIVAVINKQSNNLYAEQVFHTLGWGGASAGGGARVVETLARLGIPVKGLSVRDGSGLSRKDLVTPAAMGTLLARMVEHDESEVFLNSLAEGGERGTTLPFRLRHLPIKGKTGSLEYVRALSGYTTTPDGRTLAFVVLANNYTARSYRIEQAIDLIVETLATTQVG